MPTPEKIRESVKRFYQQYSAGTRLEDAFAPWFLHSRFKVDPREAIAQSSDGNHDSGIDGFHWDPATQKLWICQTKLSESEAQVKKGVEDLARSVGTLAKMLQIRDTDLALENRVLANLRQVLYSDGCNRAALQLGFAVIHLVDRDKELLLSKPGIVASMDAFRRAVDDGQLAGRVTLDLFGPVDMESGVVFAPPGGPRHLSFEGTDIALPDGARLLLGVGKLADFVDLYDRYRFELFSENVRMFLHAEARKERSAAQHIQKTLEEIVAGKMPAPLFAAMHNGVTLSVGEAEAPAEGRVSVRSKNRGISVLNGCQTVYTAWKFFETTRSAKSPPQGWEDRWNQIFLPVRIVATSSEELARRVTVAANRQTSISPAAFWAHDVVQKDLEARFARVGIFYERQEGAFEHLKRSDPERLPEVPNGWIGLELLARAIAGADRSLPVKFAASPHVVFDQEANYRKVFATKRLQSVRLLTFLVNLYAATRPALRDLANEVGPLNDLPSSRYHFTVYRLLVHYIMKRRREEVMTYATMILPLGPTSEIRGWALRLLKPQNSGIQTLLREVWYEGGEWQDSSDKAGIDRALSKLHLTNVDVFDGWEDFDDEFEDATNAN